MTFIFTSLIDTWNIAYTRNNVKTINIHSREWLFGSHVTASNLWHWLQRKDFTTRHPNC